jgi:hypothetical protein
MSQPRPIAGGRSDGSEGHRTFCEECAEIKTEVAPAPTGGHITVQAGRCLCQNGKPFVTLHKCDGVDPVAADDFTHLVARAVNATSTLLAERDRLRAALKDCVEQLKLKLQSVEGGKDDDAESAYQHGCAVLAEGGK